MSDIDDRLSERITEVEDAGARIGAERQARWRAAHALPIKALNMSVCIPRGGVEIAELEKSAYCTMAIFNKLVEIVEAWIDKLDADVAPADVLRAFALLAPALESLTVLREKIIEQREDEARDVTDEMRKNLEPYDKPRPKIEETLEAMRKRFEENVRKAH